MQNPDDISPKYFMSLIPKVENALWNLFDKSKYKNVKRYILKWHLGDYNSENFHIYYDNDQIDLAETLYSMPSELIIKIAIDIGVDTPGFLPSIPTFKNVLKDKNQNAFQSFERAIKNVSENPDEAVSLANATLEGIIKTVLSSEQFSDLEYNSRDTLYALSQTILKRFKIYPGAQKEIDEIQKIASGLLTACQNIESLRSTKTKSHGKTNDDYIITDTLWANFVVNSVATIGLFVSEYFEKKYKVAITEDKKEEIVPDDIPF